MIKTTICYLSDHTPIIVRTSLNTLLWHNYLCAKHSRSDSVAQSRVNIVCISSSEIAPMIRSLKLLNRDPCSVCVIESVIMPFVRHHSTWISSLAIQSVMKNYAWITCYSMLCHSVQAALCFCYLGTWKITLLLTLYSCPSKST